MKQYYSIKAKYPDALLLFRVGDFYETFGEDAIKASGILGITLTKRANGSASYIELAGFPYHSIDTYLPKLVKAGQRVAICEQLEDPKMAKGIVKRDITELVTPGVSYNDKVLEIKENNFLASIYLDKRQNGAAFLDVSTGEFYLAQGSVEYLDKLLQSFKPSEVILQKQQVQTFQNTFSDKYYFNTFDDWVFTYDFALETLLKQFKTNSLKGFGVENLEAGIIASGAALHYLSVTQHDKTGHIGKITRIEENNYVWLDKFTIRNLELLYSPHENAHTLLDVIDYTLSPMGSRMMKKWIALPLKTIQAIEQRLQVVDYFLLDDDSAGSLRQEIKSMGDLERLISKAAVARINPRELVQLKNALYSIEKIKQLCEKSKNESLRKFAEQLNPCSIIREKIETHLFPEPPIALNKGSVIAAGVNQELDELRNLSLSGKDFLTSIQQRESERTGISSLKIGFNNVFGYYLEVTNTHKDKVPLEWNRKQTLTNAERYITEELKVYEEKILGAEEKILNIESQIFEKLLFEVSEFITPIQHNAYMVAQIDCLLSFAQVAITLSYVRPEVNEGNIISIREGRHPVIETQLPKGEKYVTNDIYLDKDSQQIIIITGPNMSGKSALLRQTALIVLLAQMGCYIPAKSAEIGLVDKIFTRVGASDNISSGESTFMVEMNETASILNNVSDRSLILLDEIGRGTSTYDGISIAWAITEYLHELPNSRPKVLFATHYHELIAMEDQWKRIKNYHISVKEIDQKIIFLRKLQAGGSEHSFGIHVAKMAGMPQRVLNRANEILKQLEESHRSTGESAEKSQGKKQKKAVSPQNDAFQLSFIQLDDPTLLQIKEDILNIDIDTLTPVEALLKLHDIKKIIGKK